MDYPFVEDFYDNGEITFWFKLNANMTHNFTVQDRNQVGSTGSKLNNRYLLDLQSYAGQVRDTPSKTWCILRLRIRVIGLRSYGANMRETATANATMPRRPQEGRGGPLR